MQILDKDSPKHFTAAGFAPRVHSRMLTNWIDILKWNMTMY